MGGDTAMAPDEAGLADRIEAELKRSLGELDRPPLSAIPARYRAMIAEYILRKGQRLRPALFLLTYGGYAAREPRGIYTSAVALEFLHDFVLIHDDIVDGSGVRRRGPAMHALLEDRLSGLTQRRVPGASMAMIIGDMIYTLGMRLFLAVEEAEDRKAAALRYLIEAALYTACGELREMADLLEPIENIAPERIRETCRWKTAYYSFACPMVTAALLAGAGDREARALAGCGLAMGLAYQIHDDIRDIVDGHSGNGDEPEWRDLREGKPTLPLWYALNHGSPGDRERLAAIMKTANMSRRDAGTARDIIIRAGGINFAAEERRRCLAESRTLLSGLGMIGRGREALWDRAVRMFE